MYLCRPKLNFLRQCFRKLSYYIYIHTDRQTDGRTDGRTYRYITTITTLLNSRMATNKIMYSLRVIYRVCYSSLSRLNNSHHHHHSSIALHVWQYWHSRILFLRKRWAILACCNIVEANWTKYVTLPKLTLSWIFKCAQWVSNTFFQLFDYV